MMGPNLPLNPYSHGNRKPARREKLQRDIHVESLSSTFDRTSEVDKITLQPFKLMVVNRIDKSPMYQKRNWILFYRSFFSQSALGFQKIVFPLGSTGSTATQSPAQPSDRSAGYGAGRSPSASASPLGQCVRVSVPLSFPGSGVCYCPLASSGRGSPWSCWSRNACRWRSSASPKNPGPCPALPPDRRWASRRWPDGFEPWGTTTASAPGAGRTGQSTAGSTGSRSDLGRRSPPSSLYIHDFCDVAFSFKNAFSFVPVCSFHTKRQRKTTFKDPHCDPLADLFFNPRLCWNCFSQK